MEGVLEGVPGRPRGVFYRPSDHHRLHKREALSSKMPSRKNNVALCTQLYISEEKKKEVVNLGSESLQRGEVLWLFGHFLQAGFPSPYVFQSTFWMRVNGKWPQFV